LNKKVYTSFNKNSCRYIWILIWGKSGTDFYRPNISRKTKWSRWESTNYNGLSKHLTSL